jgi:glycosyltransferase involved in cell wall biosynthesis
LDEPTPAPQKCLHVGLVIYGSLETISGGYLYDRQMVAHLQQQGDQVEIISIPWRTYAHHLTDNYATSLFKRLASLNLNVLVQDELNHPSLAWLNQRLRAQVRYPIISLVHHLRCSEPRPAWQNRFYGWVEQRYLRGVDGFIFNSQTTRQTVRARLANGIKRPSVVAYPAGDRFHPTITPEEIELRAKLPGPLRLLFLGNLIPRKGLHLLLEALHQVEAHWELEVIGSLTFHPGYVQRVRAMVQRYRMADQVHFRDVLDHAELAQYLRQRQVLVVPSSYEGFGIVYLEGMSFGLPAIATRLGATGEIITHEQSGLLVDAQNASDLASWIDRLANDRQLLAAMGVHALHRFQAHPTWEQSMEKIRKFLLDLVG